MGRRSFISEQLKENRLVTPFDMSVFSPQNYYVVCRQDVKDSARIQAFQSWLMSEIAQADNDDLSA